MAPYSLGLGLSPEGKGKEGKVRIIYGRSSKLGFSQSQRRGRGLPKWMAYYYPLTVQPVQSRYTS